MSKAVKIPQGQVIDPNNKEHTIPLPYKISLSIVVAAAAVTLINLVFHIAIFKMSFYVSYTTCGSSFTYSISYF